MNSDILFTPSGVLDLLTQIDELKDYDIQLSESSNNIQLTIGDSSYTIDGSTANEAAAPPESVEAVNSWNDEAADALVDSDMAEFTDEEITAGILKETVKTLLVGGLVRLTTKLLRR